MVTRITTTYFCLALLPGTSLAWQLGRSLPPTVTLAPSVPKAGSCEDAFVRNLWSFENLQQIRFATSEPAESTLRGQVSLKCKPVTLGAAQKQPKKSLQKQSNRSLMPVLVHASIWSVDQKGEFVIESSETEVFHPVKSDHSFVLQQAGKNKNGHDSFWPATPALYGVRELWFMGVSCFVTRDSEGNLTDDGVVELEKKLQISYALGVTPVTPENIANLDNLLAALGGITQAPKGGLKAKPFSCSTPMVAAGRIVGPRPPFDVSLTFSAKPIAPAGAPGKEAKPSSSSGDGAVSSSMLESAETSTGSQYAILRNILYKAGQSEKSGGVAPPSDGSQNQTKTPTKSCGGQLAKDGCSSNSKVSSIDKEPIDLGLGLSIPGVLEPRYSPSNPKYMLGPTRHTDLYGTVDLFPFFTIAGKDSIAPHLVAGLPLTGQPLYRPFFGIGQNFTGWKGLKNLPFQINFIAGIVYMKQEIVQVNTQGPGLVITHERVLKPMFGLEVPIGHFFSKIPAVGSKASSNSK